MPFGFAQHFPGESEYFTFVRNPISRAVSDYHFCRKNPANPAFPAANRLSLTEFVEANYSYGQNGQVRWLSNAAYGAPFASEEAMLEEAMKNLAQISFVGITEQFDISIAPLRALRLDYALRPLAEQERLYASWQSPVGGGIERPAAPQ